MVVQDETVGCLGQLLEEHGAGAGGWLGQLSCLLCERCVVRCDFLSSAGELEDKGSS